jgi:hypothetical protein
MKSATGAETVRTTGLILMALCIVVFARCSLTLYIRGVTQTGGRFTSSAKSHLDGREI